MASRMKKIFNRKKDDEHSQSPNSKTANPTLGTSLYESIPAAGQPQQGEYPIRGNDSSAMLHQQGRNSLTRSRRSSGSLFNVPWRSPTPDQQPSQRNARMSPPPDDRFSSRDQPAPYQHQAPPPMKGQGDKKRWSRTPLPQDFANLSLGNDSPQTVTQTVTTTSFSPGPNESRNGQQNSKTNMPNRSSMTSPIQSNTQPISTPKIYKQQSTPSRETNSYNNQSQQQGRAHDVERQESIARKQVGVVTTPSRNNVDPSSPRSVRAVDSQSATGQNHLMSDRAAYPSSTSSKVQQPRADPEYRTSDGPLRSNVKIPSRDGQGHRKAVAPSQASAGPHVLDRSNPISNRAATPRSAQDIVNRAKTDTQDTQIIESLAPAVTHETIHNKVHHIREELITKEIHTHDVFHRILPVIDVEVLPPRHFLPVEGGGLVEVNASDVPGRGNNWVIAETASKIPSDQVAPADSRGFTARQFPGREGDLTRRQVDGHERTDETWVHPPELETGARDTGQSWPMVFGSEIPTTASRGHTSSGTPRKEKSGTHAGRARHSNSVGMVR